MKKGMYYLLVGIFTAILFSCANQTENNSGKKADNANAGGAMAQTDLTQPVQTQQQAANTQGQPDQTVQQQAAQTQSQSQQAGTQTDNKRQVQQNNSSQNQPAASKQDPPKQQQQPVQQPNKPAASNPQSQDPIPQEIQQSLPQMVDEQGRPMKTTITRVPEDQRKPFIPKDKQKLTDNEIQLGNAVGNDLGEFYGYGVDSSQIKLSDLRGRLVMVVLWNSLCDHCVHDLDKYLPIYNNYHGKIYNEGKSFEIFTIGLDKERATWVQALTDKNYPWKHNVYVLDSWKDPDIRFFGIKNLPGNFLINGDGIVLEKLFTPEQLPDLLEKYLKK